MTTATKESTTYLRTAARLPDGIPVDKTRNVIRGAALIQLGEVNDSRPWFVDETTIAQTMALAKQFPKGLQARWSHPSGGEGLGSYVGRWRKFRLSADGKSVLADLHIARVAFSGGDQSRGAWLQEMAAEAPDTFGVSLAMAMDVKAMKAAKRPDGKMPLRFKKLLAADIVGEPAATRGGLYGGLSVEDAPAVLAEMFSDASDDEARELFDEYLATRRGGQSPAMTGEPEMADEVKGVTIEQVNEAIEKASAATLAAITEKLDALKPAEPKQDETQLAAVAERKRCCELQALAKNAGLENADTKAQEWIDKGLSIVDAKGVIADLAIAQNKLTKDAGEPADDPDAAYRKEFRGNLAAFTSMGLTEDEYVFSRQVEDGRATLSV